MTLSKDQIRQLLHPPFAYVDPNKSEIDIRRQNFLYCTKGFENKAYNNVYIVDSLGNSFLVKRVERTGGVLFWTSILVFSPVVEVLPVTEEIKQISVSEFRQIIIATIEKKPRAWASLDSVNNIKGSINKCSTYLEIMRIFNTKV